MPYAVFILVWAGFNLVWAALSALLASRWGRDPFSWLLLGSLLGPFAFLALIGLRQADKASNKPERPRTPQREAGDRVLLAADGSPATDLAAAYIGEHLSPGAQKVDVVTVLPMEAMGDPAGEARDVRPHFGEEARTRVERVCNVLGEAGIECDRITLFGDPAEQILALAQNGSYGLIVMGRRGHGKVGKFLLGSVSDRVVRSAPCPVTVVG